MSQNLYDIPLRTIQGQPTTLGAFKGKALLVVNVASECGLTPQYAALERLHESYASKGLAVLGFPANEFGAQEPGTNAEIQDFCQSKFGVKFPMFEKIVVKGPGQHPLYKALTDALPVAQSKNGTAFEDKLRGYGLMRETKQDVLWNFEKFLIRRDGKPVARFNPDMTPDDPTILEAIESALK
jgi:glutathione peroxidase